MIFVIVLCAFLYPPRFFFFFLIEIYFFCGKNSKTLLQRDYSLSVKTSLNCGCLREEKAVPVSSLDEVELQTCPGDASLAGLCKYASGQLKGVGMCVCLSVCACACAHMRERPGRRQ